MDHDQRLKILWISHFLPYPPRGGSLIRSFYLLQQLSRYHDIDLISFSNKKLVEAYYSSYEIGLKEIGNALSEICNIKKIFTLPHRKSHTKLIAMTALILGKSYTERWLITAEAKNYFNDEIDWTAYDAIHIDTISLVPLLPKSLLQPAVLNHHNIESAMMWRRHEKESSLIKSQYFKLESRRLHAFEKNTAQRFAAHLACSEIDKENLLAIAPGINVATIPNGIAVDQSRHSSRAPIPPAKLIFIGGLDWYPNKDAVMHFFTEIWPLLIQKIENLEVHIIGKNPPSSLIDITRSFTQVHFHGFVPDISTFYKEAAVYICPIRDGGGTKLKVLDALAHGVPLVGYPEACEGIDILDGIHARVAKTPQEFAEITAEILNNPEASNQLGVEGKKLIEDKYDVVKIGAKLANLYTDLKDKHELA